MFRTGLSRYKNSNVNNFTSDIGIKLRRVFLDKCWRKILRMCTSRKIVIEQYPTLDKNEVYIFACNHSFDEDVISALASIDRNAYMLQGTTHQMEHNPIFLAMWLNGMIYVNRLNKVSRADAVNKMERILKAGSSVILFPEGGYNNTENQLIMPLFSSPYIFPSLTVNKRQNSRKACIYGLCGCLFVCIDMCYIFAFVLVIFFVFEIIPRMEAFDMNSKSVLNPNEL